MEKIKEPKIGEGSRKHSGKPMYELLEPFAISQVVNVFTKGKNKYPDPPHNWLYGMKWSRMLASAKRHIAAFEQGHDRDIDPNCEACKKSLETGEWECTNHTGELHTALAAWNMLGLTSYYKWYPQGDDRLNMIMPRPRIGLDIDEVIANWIDPWMKLWDIKDVPHTWFFDGKVGERFERMRKEGILEDFFLSLEPSVNPKEIPFEPWCYVTSRPISSEITTQWLRNNNFPIRPVYTVGHGESKVKVIKEAGCDIFVDDRYDNFEELNRNGICCYLLDAPHNRRYDVGERRIKSLKELAR